MNQPPPPGYIPSREAIEADRLAREARERTAANDQLVITIWRVCGGIGIAVAIVMMFISFRAGGRGVLGRVLIRAIIFGGGGLGALVRGNSLASRRHVVPPMMMHQQHFRASPPPHQQQQPPGDVNRWTD